MIKKKGKNPAIRIYTGFSQIKFKKKEKKERVDSEKGRKRERKQGRRKKR